ncbi:hypothetical protein AArcCO_1397 [Halalkaliarchaeum sp. AArc-CO]|uniref:hypothetical protein n=1 Tax=Halalkaliarchaeum sp. AArc-CO TaxID=2866381 RepID=UPI00217D80B6|nr:hypothetical protein [Halalkaliarchaeum sp. AArc-CO]UWG50704.1 hypothetical protein AArcCO_1397 [Halalkaliarchaeum sp. AArc-CO]
MLTFTKHDTATCPDCGSPLVYGTKEEASGWKVYYECNDRCGFERMAGWVKLSDIEHRDEVNERAREMGERWAGP